MTTGSSQRTVAKLEGGCESGSYQTWLRDLSDSDLELLVEHTRVGADPENATKGDLHALSARLRKVGGADLDQVGQALLTSSLAPAMARILLNAPLMPGGFFDTLRRVNAT